MLSSEIRERFLKFFEKRGHTIIPSASLIPENDPSVLFNTAGMQPLVPYLLGASHPTGATRLADAQKCVRTNDIDEIGDNTHATFFEMLGNWSLGDYFKEDAIKWSFEFLTSKEEGLGLDASRLYVTVFEGDENAPRDEESYAIWKKLFDEKGVKGERIYFMSAKSNWWSPGDNGPCGPDTEMFYDVTGKITEGMTKEEYMKADDEQKVVEIWNDVFMEYEKKDGKVIGKLAKKNVDTGSGLERVTMVVQGKNNIYETDLLKPVMDMIKIETRPIGKQNILESFDHLKAKRVISDHMRTSVHLIADGVVPSNSDQGYILRRFIRRSATYSHFVFGIQNLSDLVDVIVEIYKDSYPHLLKKKNEIKSIIWEEERKFRKTLDVGAIRLQKIIAENLETKEKILRENISAKSAFDLFQTDGFPIELTIEIAKANNMKVDVEGFKKLFTAHQELSRAGSEQKFKGGLADTSEISTRYHTATHLLHKALRIVLGDHVFQKGSNITAERMRFDFSHPEKMTDEQKQKVEDLVNEQIKRALPVSYEDISIEEARKRNAMGLFGDKYGDTVRVYTIGDFSMEICGGPHVQNTSELGHFKIVKEEAVSAGVRRIKAVLD